MLEEHNNGKASWYYSSVASKRAAISIYAHSQIQQVVTKIITIHPFPQKAICQTNQTKRANMQTDIV
jgi:hypothetical protein